MPSRFFLLLACCAVGAWCDPAGPCDLYEDAGTPCVGAFSLVRALYAAFDGPLYYVRRASDNTTRAVPLQSAGGYVNATVQEAFCFRTDCVVWRLVDQSPFNNDLTVAPPGGPGCTPQKLAPLVKFSAVPLNPMKKQQKIAHGGPAPLGPSAVHAAAGQPRRGSVPSCGRACTSGVAGVAAGSQRAALV